MPGSCSSGFRSRPSAAAGKQPLERIRRQQHEQQEADADRAPSRRSRAPAICSGRWRLNTATATVHTVSISTHSSSEPSCEPQVAASRYCSGSCEFELVATFSTEKSLCDERPRETAERDRDERELRLARRTRERHPRRVAARRARDRQHALRERQQQREYQCELADFRNHVLPLLGDHAFLRLLRLLDRVRRRRAACSFRRAWRAPRSRGTRRRASSLPCATTPLPSLNRSGRMPV